MITKNNRKKTNLNPIIIAGFVVIGLLLVIIAAMGNTLTPLLRTQIVPTTAPSIAPPTEKQCGPQKLLEKAGPWDVSRVINFRPSPRQERLLFAELEAMAKQAAGLKCEARASETPSVDFYACPTPSPKPTDYVCIENSDNTTSCTLAGIRDLKTAPKPEEWIATGIVSCVQNPGNPVRISDREWKLNITCKATCLCQRACDVKESNPIF